MQCGPLKVVICGRWEHCFKVIHRPGVCYCAVLSVVRKMSESKVHVRVEQRIIIKFLTKAGCKPSAICSRLKKRYGEKTLSNVSAYKWSSIYLSIRNLIAWHCKQELHEWENGKPSACHFWNFKRNFIQIEIKKKYYPWWHEQPEETRRPIISDTSKQHFTQIEMNQDLFIRGDMNNFERRRDLSLQMKLNFWEGCSFAIK